MFIALITAAVCQPLLGGDSEVSQIQESLCAANLAANNVALIPRAGQGSAIEVSDEFRVQLRETGVTPDWWELLIVEDSSNDLSFLRSSTDTAPFELVESGNFSEETSLFPGTALDSKIGTIFYLVHNSDERIYLEVFCFAHRDRVARHHFRQQFSVGDVSQALAYVHKGTHHLVLLRTTSENTIIENVVLHFDWETGGGRVMDTHQTPVPQATKLFLTPHGPAYLDEKKQLLIYHHDRKEWLKPSEFAQ